MARGSRVSEYLRADCRSYPRGPLPLLEPLALGGQTAKHAEPLDHFVEVGVWRGGTGILTARAMARNGLRQPIYLCDTFQGVTKTGINDPDYRGGEHSDTSIEIVTTLAETAGLSSKDFEIVVGIFPEDMPRELQTGDLSLLISTSMPTIRLRTALQRSGRA